MHSQRLLITLGSAPVQHRGPSDYV